MIKLQLMYKETVLKEFLTDKSEISVGREMPATTYALIILPPPQDMPEFLKDRIYMPLKI